MPCWLFIRGATSVRPFSLWCFSSSLHLPRKHVITCQSGRAVSSTSFPPEKTRLGFDNYEAAKNQRIHIPEHFNFTRDVIDRWSREQQEGTRPTSLPALWFVHSNGRETKWNFQELSSLSKRVANFFQTELGLDHGDSIMNVLPHTPSLWPIVLAAIRTGVISSTGTVQLTSNDIFYRMSALQPSCIFASETTAVAVDKVAHQCQFLKHKVLVAEKAVQRTGWLNFHDLLEKATEDHEFIETKSSDPVMVFFTSGTTGYPKMVEQMHGNYVLGHVATGRYALDATPQDIIWCVSDPGWVKFAYSNIFGPWLMGSCVFVQEMPQFKPSLVLECLQQFPITTLCLPPTGYRMVLLQDVKKFKFSALNYCLSGGESLSPEVLFKWRDATGLTIREFYGQSESVALCGNFRSLKLKPGSMGKPNPTIPVTIVDENGHELGPGKEGVIAVRTTPHYPIGLFKQYKGDPIKTANVFRHGYYYTGDLAYKDEEGYFWFTGRNDDIINSAGYRIGPVEVENAIIEHPAVAESAVVASPDSQRGQVVKAFIVLKDSYKDHDKEKLTAEIQAHVKKVTAPYKYPRKVEFVQQLPKTISGKVRRVELRNRE